MIFSRSDFGGLIRLHGLLNFFCARFLTMEKKCSPTKPEVFVAVFIMVLLDKGLLQIPLS